MFKRQHNADAFPSLRLGTEGHLARHLVRSPTKALRCITYVSGGSSRSWHKQDYWVLLFLLFYCFSP